jgi:hypothetical protein
MATSRLWSGGVSRPTEERGEAGFGRDCSRSKGEVLVPGEGESLDRLQALDGAQIVAKNDP